MPRLGLPLALLALLLLPTTTVRAEKLSEDGRAAQVTDRQGVALVRPAGRARWTPLGARSLLFPGDVVRTEARGANALEIRLAP